MEEGAVCGVCCKGRGWGGAGGEWEGGGRDGKGKA